MSIRCPHCRHVMELKGARPGRFTPRCPECQHRFLLVISPDPTIAPVVALTGGADHGSMPGATLAPHPDAGHGSMAPGTRGPAATAAPGPAATLPLAATVPPGVTSLPPVGLQGPPGDRPLPGAGRKSVPDDEAPQASPPLSGTLGGYELKQKLGEGGMGAVYLARQVSLDRDVALKVLAPRLAADPQFVARFTREAYAAAQLTHHNVVQIHDIGFDREANFFSMEFVAGQTLEKLVREAGRLDPEAAVGYVLQAARGLRFAHQNGLVHRDVKPDNLLLNDQGIVKVADLGLVKQADSPDAPGGASTGGRPARSGSRVGTASAASATQFNVSMGTPAYMAPEQARDAAHVDNRADIYSLGCTLYDLLVGRPPFVGQTTVEVIAKHQREAMVPPDRLVRHVPAELSRIVMRMTAKRPDERYQSMTEVINALEAFLGVESGKPFSPTEEHVRTLEAAVEQFNGSGWAKVRSTLAYAFFGACAAGALVCALPQVGMPLLAGGLVGFVLLTAVAYQVLIGFTRKTHVFRQVRQYLFGSRLVDWLKFLTAAAVVVLLLVAFELQWVWLGFAVAAVGVAAAFHFSIDRLAERERRAPLGRLDDMLRTMRLKGLEENALRQFVCKYAGERWEEVYEALFGYEATRAARRAWGKGERGADRKRHAAWRDVLVDWVDRRAARRRAEREQRLLTRLEAKALAAEGIDEATAARKARRTADEIVHTALRAKAEADRRAMMTAAPAARGTPSTKARPAAGVTSLPGERAADGSHGDGQGGDDEGEDDFERVHEGYLKRRYGTPLDFLLGPPPRVVLGAVLICGFALWVKLNGAPVVANTDALKERLDPSEIAQGKQLAEGTVAAVRKIDVKFKSSRPLRIGMVPDPVCDAVGSYNGGIAAALLLLSGFFAGKLLGLTVLAGAAVTLAGHQLDVPVLQGHPWVAAGAGAGIGLLGIALFRRERD